MEVLQAVWGGLVAFVKSSPIQVLTAIIASASFYRTFLQRPRLVLLPADSIRIILGMGEGVTALHIMCNVTNNGARTGVIQRLEAKITPPGFATDTFVWDQFYRYREGGWSLEKESDPHPIAVGPRDSKVLRVHFAPPGGQHRFDWRGGEYLVELQGWVNRGSRNRRPNLIAKLHFFVTEMEAVEFRDKFHPEPTAMAYPSRRVAA